MSTRAPLSIALRAFEAAARNLSFTLAGLELHITQSAVSRQIRLLENYLGQPLFERYTRRIKLTPAGRDYYLDVQNALGSLDRATQRVMSSAGRTVLAIRVLPSLGTTWLMPRLPGFVAQHPHVDVQLTMSIDIADLQAAEADVVLGVGHPPGASYPENAPRVDSEVVSQWRGVRADYLAPDVLLTVMAPSLLRKGKPVRRPADLLGFRLLHTRSRRAAWDEWLRAHSLAVPPGDRTTFGHYFMALRAAENGQGIAIIPSLLVPQEGLGKNLVEAIRTDLPSAGAYYLASLESRAGEPSIKAFREWVLGEAEVWLQGDMRRRTRQVRPRAAGRS